MDTQAEKEAEPHKDRRRHTECVELSTRFLYRRGFSEVNLLEAMRYSPLKSGYTYNFITAGDCDSLTFLKIVLNQHSLDHLLFSTWCMAAEDLLQFTEWYESGKIRKLDMYLGEIFPSTYRIEWSMVQNFYRDHPEAGRVAVFRNHSKIYAGCSEADNFYFGIQSSANINTNPRTEQASITVDEGIYRFYKEYFDGIKSFV